MNRIYLIGYMGCGKTTIGRRLAEKLKYQFVDLDAFIEKKYHKSIADIFTEFGQEHFREIEQSSLLEVSTFENTVVATGGGAPCYHNNMQLMTQTGFTVYIKLNAIQLAYRLAHSRAGKRPLIADKNGQELLDFVEEALLQREPYYNKATQTVSGSDEFIIDEIIEQINTSN